MPNLHPKKGVEHRLTLGVSFLSIAWIQLVQTKGWSRCYVLRHDFSPASGRCGECLAVERCVEPKYEGAAAVDLPVPTFRLLVREWR